MKPKCWWIPFTVRIIEEEQWQKKNESVYHYSLWFQFWQKWFLYWFLYSNIKAEQRKERQFWDLIIFWRSVKFNFFTYIYYISWHVGSREVININNEISIQVSNTDRGSFISFVVMSLKEAWIYLPPTMS